MSRASGLFAVMVLALGCSSGGKGDDDDGEGGGGDPVQGDAYLTIVGDSNVFLELGQSQQIRVKYHDGDGNPLAGEVAFAISGAPSGSTLSAATDVTDAGGGADVLVSAGQAQVSFRVVAQAEFTTAVEWRVAVGQGLGALDVSGPYALDSQFDFATGLGGDAGGVVNTFTDMTDGPLDPASWLIDELVDNIDSGLIRGAINVTRPALDSVVNQTLISASPNLVTMLKDVGNDFGQVVDKFGMRSRLTIASTTAVHEITGFHWTIDGVNHEYSADDVGVGVVKAENVGITFAMNKLTIAEHTLPLSYGQLLVFVLNRVIVPSAIPFAGSLEDLLNSQIDCREVGWDIYREVDFGDPSLFEAACLNAIAAATDALEDRIRAIDGSGSSLTLKGDANPTDTNGDARVDRLMTGLWEGSYRIGGSVATLARPDQKFVGERMPTP